jgi:hypothetical protein
MTTGRITNGGSEAGNARQAVMIEWTDTDITNTTFEGTGREIIRVQHRSQIHPMGDMLFNPLAGPGDPDWRVMYVAVGDGGSGETTGSARDNPQRLDQVQGKILRIIPDLNEHTETSSVSDNGRYRIPNDNPFVDVDGARDELYTVGHRNHHRLTWDVNPENPEDNQLIVNEIGLHTWEEVNFIHAGANYGYSEREGNEVLISNSETGPLPNPDLIPWQVNGSTTNGTVTPTYPVIQYGHDPSQSNVYGDAIADGFVYRGSEIPELYGMYLFGDISTGQLFYANYAEMQAADDGDPSTMAEIHTLDLLWDNPDDNPDQGEELYTDITPGGALLGAAFQIVELKYHERGGSNDNLPGGAAATGINGRADIRLLVDGDGEPYLFSKSDGMIRRFIPFEILIANPGDYNDDGVVNAADYVVWRNNQGTENPLANDAIGGEIGNEHYTQWFENFGNVLEGDNSLSTVPEPSALCLIFFALATSAMLRNQR